MTSVLQDWVMELPLRAQGTLLTGIRGCDTAPKLFEPDANGYLECNETTERQLTAFLRFCVMNPADPREVDIKGAFFKSEAPLVIKVSELMHYPTHWLMHLVHCFEVVGYMHPDRTTRGMARRIYEKFVDGFHMNEETKDQMLARMNEDRIAAGTVVS